MSSNEADLKLRRVPAILAVAVQKPEKSGFFVIGNFDGAVYCPVIFCKLPADNNDRNALMFKHIIVAAVAALSLSGCATDQQQPAPALQTKSGKPEVEINAPIEKVKSAIIESLVGGNFPIDQETDHTVVGAREVTDFQEKAGFILNGVHADTKVEKMFVITILPSSNSVRLIGEGKIRLSKNGNSEVRDNMTGHKEALDSIQEGLDLIKKRAEAK